MPNMENAIITTNEMRAAKGLKPGEVDAQQEAKWELAIAAASAAVRKFADRSFGKTLEEAVRIYEYEHDGLLDIDDASEVKEVTFIFGQMKFKLEPFYWRAEPQEGPPYNYLKIPHWSGVYDPAMGFTRNMDVIAKERGWPWIIPQVEVKAMWGWEIVPEDVKQATILTAMMYAEDPQPWATESIAGYARTTAIRSTAGPGQMDLVPTAIPGRAQDLLLPYVRFQI